MDGSTLKDIIGQKRPKYRTVFKSLIDSISIKGDSSGKGNYSTFGAYYQTFMYAFFIGYNMDNFVPIIKGEHTTDFASFVDWKPIAVRDFILMLLLNKSEDFEFKWIDLEDANEETLNVFITELFRRMEGYANAGFEYLQDKFDNEKVEFQDPFVFINFLEAISEKQLK